MVSSMKRHSLARLCLQAILCPWMLAVPSSAGDFQGKKVFPGIDVSAYQGIIDFNAVRDSGVRVVYIRAGVDGRPDDYLRRNYEGARNARLNYGFYYFVTAKNEKEAREQAGQFASLLEGKRFNARPVMDFERFGDLSKEEINRIGLAFVDELQRLTGILPMVYTDSYNAETVWNRSFASYPLWLADYQGTDNPETGVWSDWQGFQYTDKGQVPGIEGPVDLNYFTPEVLLYTTERPGEYHPDAPEILRYTVRAGETLRGIARKFGVSVAALVHENHIEDPSLIYVGEVLRIPEEEETDRYFLYTVKKGDNLWNLSRKFGTTVSTLAKDNYIPNPSLIYIGDVLRIPKK